MHPGISGADKQPTDSQPDRASNKDRMLHHRAEVSFSRHGGSRCSVCHAHVRHAVEVLCERADGTTETFSCLCTRCLVAEEVRSKRVILKLGKVQVESRGSGRRAA